MPTYIEMPKLSDTMTEGTLVKWHKSEGDTVDIGDVIAEIETDKATMEMEAFDEGKLGKIYVQEGSKVAIGEVMAALVEEGEEAPDTPEKGGGPAPESEGKDKASEGEDGSEDGGDKDKDKESESESEPEGNPEPEPEDTGERVKASPLARKIAKEKGVKLGGIKGTGPGGRIVAADVESAKPGGGSGKAGGAKPGPAPIVPKAGEGDQKIQLSGMRTIIAERLLASKTQIPHFYLHIDVDAAPIMALRKQVNAASEDDEGANKYTVNDFILKAVVAAAVENPAVNASFAGDHIVQFASVHLSVAVAVDDGLVTPVIKDAQSQSLLGISRAVKDLAGRARSKKLKPDEMQGGTITVSSLGAYGISYFDAIINPPQAAILSIGAIAQKPVVDAAGNLVAGTRMDVGLSCDHRVVDGAVGAAYLASLKKYIERPALMLV
ncbi:pyruvate dehydrogenase complex dihydrolipoamide acetyltransferase [soil metagenome]